MIKYKVTIEAEIHVPDYHSDSIPTPDELRESLLKTSKGSNGYAICTIKEPSKFTAQLHVMSVTFDSTSCEACGHKTPLGEKVP